jgi:hypothetical protein
MKKLLITQSNYIPWIGYFDAISQVDEFVIYDCVQFTRRDWRNRNKILTANGERWLSIPVQVKGKYFQSIEDTHVVEEDWASQHWKTIVQSYSKAPYFSETKKIFEELYMNPASKKLSDINYSFIKAICKYLDIKTDIRWHREFKLAEERNERLLGICKQAQADIYLSGPAAKSYMDLDLFEQNGVSVLFFQYDNFKFYPQLHDKDKIYLSIIDMIFNIGPETKSYLGKSRLVKGDQIE